MLSGAFGTPTMRPDVRLPPPVRPGDRVGVAALSGPVDPGRLDAGLQALAELGFEPVRATNLRSKSGLFAGSDDERLAAFHTLVDDPSVRAIVFARGGHGVLRLLPRFDWRRLARIPRAYVGYSDLVPFLLEVVRRLGWVSFHGPMVAADLARGLDDGERESLLAALAGDFPRSCPLAGAVGEPVEGPLLGGCLSMLVSVLGTPWAQDLSGGVVFLEDIEEPWYRLDRMLTQLRLSGNLTNPVAMLAGHLTLLDGPRPTPAVGASRGPSGWLEDSLAEQASSQTWPWGWGLPAGHQGPNWTMPLGLRARFEPAASRLILGVRIPDGGAGPERG